jgi:uncharacterized protein (UPF0333 family)
LLAHGRWFSPPGTPASSTTKTGRHDIAEILLKVALNTKNQSPQVIGVSTSFYKKSMSGCAQFTNGQCTVNKKNKKRKIIYYICVKL